MMGYTGKLLFVDLTEGSFEEKELSTIWPIISSALAFVTGPLTATGALVSGRYTVVCKSPVTGAWNDANSGGHFGPELKKAGFDAVFISGVSEKPVYLWINDGMDTISAGATIAWAIECFERG